MRRGGKGITGRITVARLRRWLAVGVMLLIAALAGFIGYARYRMLHARIRIPGNFGVDVKSEGNGFTISRSSGGHKIFTIHAAREVQHRNDTFTLNDVSLILYGPAGTNRSDTVQSRQFEYDKPNGLVRADGTVHIDVSVPQNPDADRTAGASTRRLQITTSGFVFDQKTNLAATDQIIQFQYGDLQGQARGLRYDARTGMLELLNDVSAVDTEQGRSSTLKAASAEIDRNRQQTSLRAAILQAAGGTLRSDAMLLTSRGGGGSLDKVFADGDVRIRNTGQNEVRAPHLVAQMSPENRPETARLFGGLQLSGKDRTGSASEGTLRFDGNGQVKNVRLSGAVRLRQAGAKSSDTQTLTAPAVVASFAGTGPAQKRGAASVITNVVASGGAQLVTTHTVAPEGKPALQESNTLLAATLTGSFSDHNGKPYLEQVNGTGGATLRQTDSSGLVRTSHGDMLVAHLLPPSPRASADSELQSATLDGHVVLTSHQPSAPAETDQKAAGDSRATGDHAQYDGSTGRIVLTGAPMLSGDGYQVFADRITARRSSGDLQGDGNVRITLRQGNTSGMANVIHVLASHAEVRDNGNAATFTAPGGAVRLWSATSAVQAPTVELNRGRGQLHAFGASAVSLLLNPASSTKGNTPPVHISASDMTFDQAAQGGPGIANFRGPVRVEQNGAVLTADAARAVFAPQPSHAATPRAASLTALPTGNLQQMTATGNVHLSEPGRSATGEKLVYTAADQKYVLTGTASHPPVLTDSLRGSSTADELIFHGGNDSVEVTGAPGRRVQTETRAKPDARTH